MDSFDELYVAGILKDFSSYSSLKSKKNKVRGGFEFDSCDIFELKCLIDHDKSYCKEFHWCPDYEDPLQDLFPISNELIEEYPGLPYIYRLILEDFGVLCSFWKKCIARTGQTVWIMRGMCPFHRRVHSQQHWCLIKQESGVVIMTCLHKNPDGNRVRCTLGKIPMND